MRQLSFSASRLGYQSLGRPAEKSRKQLSCGFSKLQCVHVLSSHFESLLLTYNFRVANLNLHDSKNPGYYGLLPVIFLAFILFKHAAFKRFSCIIRSLTVNSLNHLKKKWPSGLSANSYQIFSVINFLLLSPPVVS